MALVLFLALGLGLVLYSLYHLLIKRDKVIFLELTPDGRIARLERSTGARKKSEVVVGVILAVLGSLFLAMLILFVVLRVGQARGVHVCSNSNYLASSLTCTRDDAVIPSNIADSYLAIGTKDGSKFEPGPLIITLYRQDPSGAFVWGGYVVYTVKGTGTHTAFSLSDVFSAAQINPIPGTYEVKAQNGSANASPGTATFRIAPIAP